MTRTAPIKRRSSAPRRGPAGIPRDEWRNAPYRRFLAQRGRCAVCGEGSCDPAHGPVNGMSSKGPDCECIPLCRFHHNEQHAILWPAKWEAEAAILESCNAEQARVAEVDRKQATADRIEAQGILERGETDPIERDWAIAILEMQGVGWAATA